LWGKKQPRVLTPVWTWNDQWTFTAAGIPSVSLWTQDDDFNGHFYHTNLDTSALIDWSFFAKNSKLHFALTQKLDGGLLPYDLGARAGDLAGAVDAKALVADGADPKGVARLGLALSAFGDAARGFESRRRAIPPSHQAAVNQGLQVVEVVLNASLT